MRAYTKDEVLLGRYRYSFIHSLGYGARYPRTNIDKNKQDSSNLQCLHNLRATLNALAYMVCVKQFVMSLPATSLTVDWFSVSRVKQHPSVGSLYKWSWKTVISPHRASMHAVFKCDLFASIA